MAATLGCTGVPGRKLESLLCCIWHNSSREAGSSGSNLGLRTRAGLKGAGKQWSNPCYAACHCWCEMALICHRCQVGTSPPLSWDLTPGEWAEWGIGCGCWSVRKLTESIGDHFRGACKDYSGFSLSHTGFASVSTEGRSGANQEGQKGSRGRAGSSKPVRVRG